MRSGYPADLHVRIKKANKPRSGYPADLHVRIRIYMYIFIYTYIYKKGSHIRSGYPADLHVRIKKANAKNQKDNKNLETYPVVRRMMVLQRG